jgi:hypothetical protein
VAILIHGLASPAILMHGPAPAVVPLHTTAIHAYTRSILRVKTETQHSFGQNRRAAFSWLGDLAKPMGCAGEVLLQVMRVPCCCR